MGHSTDRPGCARPPACSGEATAGPCVTWGKRMAMDGGLDNWIAANLSMETKENVRAPVSFEAQPV